MTRIMSHIEIQKLVEHFIVTMIIDVYLAIKLELKFNLLSCDIEELI